MDFYRYHGLGNDYLVIDPNKTTLRITTESVRAICRPHFGEGSDGLLYGPLFTDNGEIQLRIFIPMAVKRRKVEMEPGSSSCAAAAAFRLGLTGNSVTVHMPGGSLDIVIRDNYAIQMTGPVVFVSKGVFSDEIFD